MQIGRNERAIRRYVKERGELSGVQLPLVEMAYTLARTLDEGASLATAAVARQYQATLAALEARDDSDSGAGFVAGLLTPVDDASDGPANKGRRTRAVRGGAGDTADAVAAARRRRGAGTGP